MQIDSKLTASVSEVLICWDAHNNFHRWPSFCSKRESIQLAAGENASLKSGIRQKRLNWEKGNSKGGKSFTECSSYWTGWTMATTHRTWCHCTWKYLETPGNCLKVTVLTGMRVALSHYGFIMSGPINSNTPGLLFTNSPQPFGLASWSTPSSWSESQHVCDETGGVNLQQVLDAMFPGRLMNVYSAQSKL